MRAGHRHACAAAHEFAEHAAHLEHREAAPLGLDQFGMIGLDGGRGDQQLAVRGHTGGGLFQCHVESIAMQGLNRAAVTHI